MKIHATEARKRISESHATEARKRIWKIHATADEFQGSQPVSRVELSTARQSVCWSSSSQGCQLARARLGFQPGARDKKTHRLDRWAVINDFELEQGFYERCHFQGIVVTIDRIERLRHRTTRARPTQPCTRCQTFRGVVALFE